MISGHTRVLAVIGQPVAHSRSPALHNAWLQAAGIDAVYVALEHATVDPATLVRGGLWGANVTIPLKTRCTPDGLTADATATGAVNTLFWDGDALVGDNTDVEGFRVSTMHALGDLHGSRCVVLGAGGAARAVVLALQRACVDQIVVASRRQVDLGVLVAPLGPEATRGADIVIQTLPAAGRPMVEAMPLPSVAWIDLNYWDPDPPKRQDAIDAGVTWVDGHGMLEAQAARSFLLWTGQEPPFLDQHTADQTHSGRR